LGQFTFLKAKLTLHINNSSKGYELTEFDGVNDPKTVIDLIPGSGSISPRQMMEFAGKLFYVASGPSKGREIWSYDLKTMKNVTDLWPGVTGANPSFMTELNGELFFSANTPEYGTALWKLCTPNTKVNANGTSLSAVGIGTSYQWINCSTGKAIAGATNKSYNTQSQSGEFALAITTSCGTDTSICVDMANLSAKHLAGPMVNVYPNPTNHFVNVDGKGLEISKLEIYDIRGQLLNSNRNKEKIDVAKLQAGVYLIRIHTNQGISSQRFIKD